MARFKSNRYPELLVKFSDGSRVKFTGREAEVDGATADRLVAFAKDHPEYQIEQTEQTGADDRLTPKQALQQKARDLGLDDSGKVADIEARIAAHEAAQQGQGADEDADDQNDEDSDDDAAEADSSEDDEN